MNKICKLSTKILLYQTRRVQSSRQLFKEAAIPHNILKEEVTADRQPENGSVYDKKPFRMTLEANKKYSWCLCGKSKTQPLCDGTHRMVQLKIKLKPVRFAVAETKEYWLCNCKHTSNRPFCDGTHKRSVVQESSSTVRQ